MYEIVFIMGKSASGKDSIYKKLLENEKLNLKKVTIYTTRPKRTGETEGVEYHFVNDDAVKKLKKDNRIIEIREYDTVYGVWKYFTADDGQIELESGERYIVIGTLEAYNGFVKYYGKEHILPIYIEVEDGIRLERALNREKQQSKPAYEEMCRRFIADTKDFSEENLKISGIEKRFSNNKDIDDCIQECIQEIKNT